GVRAAVAIDEQRLYPGDRVRRSIDRRRAGIAVRRSGNVDRVRAIVIDHAGNVVGPRVVLRDGRVGTGVDRFRRTRVVDRGGREDGVLALVASLHRAIGKRTVAVDGRVGAQLRAGAGVRALVVAGH